MRRFMPVIFAGLIFISGQTTTQAAAAITISGPFHLRDHAGPNSLGVPTGDRQLFGATNVTHL